MFEKLTAKIIVEYCDYLCWRIAGGTTGEYIVSAFTGTKMKIMFLVSLVLLVVGFAGSVYFISPLPIAAALLAVGYEGGKAFEAYGRSDAAYTNATKGK